MRKGFASQPSQRWLPFLLALSTGLIAANIYYAQPLVGPVSRELGQSPQSAGLIGTLTQVGYVLALLYIVSLADLIENKRLALSGWRLLAWSPRFPCF